MAKNKPVAVSGVKPSGDLQLGNYLGALKQFPAFQENHETYFFIADLHAITVPQDPILLRKRTLNIVALYIACGLDPQKTILFTQSHIPQHVELGWIFNTITPLGELERMTQFKEKSEKSGLLAGLLNYPTLMAADILMYQPDVVPVGEDQLQHLELTRTIARKFNNQFGETFKEPKASLQKDAARIMSLQYPDKKMSKSDEDKNGCIELLDSADEIRRKVKIAVTDSGNEVIYNPETKPAISNLLSIYSLLKEIAISELEKQYKDKSYAEFKTDLAEVIVGALSPIQKKYHELMKDEAQLIKILRDGATKARALAETTMQMVRSKVGLLEQ